MTTTPTRRADILISGGSFAGLALALAVSHESRGELHITVVSPDLPPLDTATPPGNIRASALSRGSLHLLAHLGLWRDLAPHAQPVTSIELTDSNLDDALRPTRLRYDLDPHNQPPTLNPSPQGGGEPASLAAAHSSSTAIASSMTSRSNGRPRSPLEKVVPSPLVGEGQGGGAAAFAHRSETHAPLPRMVIIENHRLGAALHQAARAAPGITLLAGVSTASYIADLNSIHATLSNGQNLKARLLVAADGSRSRLREQAGIRTVGHPYNQSGIITIVEPELPHEGRAIQHFLPAGPFALLPMTGNRICVTWTEDATEARRILTLDPPGFRAEVERRFGHQLGDLRSISPPQSWPLTLVIAANLIAPRFALVGDAAHTVHPIAGQGLNLGFRDVAALTETILDAAKLGLDIGQANTLERYERWRRFDNLASAAGYDVINGLFATRSTLARSARSAALNIADRLPALKAWLTDEASGETGDVPKLLRAQPHP